MIRRRILQKPEFQSKYVNEIDLVIRIGDSNENGTVTPEPVGMPSVYTEVRPNVLIYYRGDREYYPSDGAEWQKYSCRVTATENINRTPGYSYSGSPPYGVGTDQSFTYELSIGSPRHFGVIKIGKGGSSLIAQVGGDNDWQKDEADAIETDSELYTTLFFVFLNRGLRDLRSTNKYGIKYGKVNIKAVIIRLGTNDCVTGIWNTASFTAAIPALVSQIRAKTRSDLPIYWVQVHSALGSAPSGSYLPADVTACRAAINNCAAGGSTPISGFNVINYDSHTLQADGVHFDYDSYVAQGENEAEIILGL